MSGMGFFASQGARCAAGCGQGLTSRAGAGVRVHVSGDAAGGGGLANWLLPATGRPSCSRWRGFYSPRRGAHAQPAGRKAPPLSIWAHGPRRRRALRQRSLPSPAVLPDSPPCTQPPCAQGRTLPAPGALRSAENSVEIEASELGEQSAPMPTVAGIVMCQLVWAKGCPDSR